MPDYSPPTIENPEGGQSTCIFHPFLSPCYSPFCPGIRLSEKGALILIHLSLQLSIVGPMISTAKKNDDIVDNCHRLAPAGSLITGVARAVVKIKLSTRAGGWEIGQA